MRSRPKNGFRDEVEAEQVVDALIWVSGIVTVWPPPQEYLHAARKWDVIRDLDYIAATETHTKRPETHLVVKGVPIHFKNHFVFKREASDCCEHRHFRDGPLTVDGPPKEALPSKYRWIVQDLVDDLRKGELRCYVVNGQLLGVVGTSCVTDDNCWKSWQVDRVRTLKEMWYVRISPSRLRSDHIFHVGNLPRRMKTLRIRIRPSNFSRVLLTLGGSSWRRLYLRHTTLSSRSSPSAWGAHACHCRRCSAWTCLVRVD